MSRLRNAVADLLVGAVVILVAFWLLRRVIGLVIGGVYFVLLILLVILVLRVASKIRG